jgi:nicotinate phosphoribosyltransferase
VFPGEPLLRVHAPLVEAQLLESALLNIVNFQTLIATKAARVRAAARGGTIIEFGLRRAQGPDGALSAARAAYIGGAAATSNTHAAKHLGLPLSGTMAHSWVMAFPDELTAFRAYASAYPEKCILLIDTYDTLASGLPNAIVVGRELAATGHRGFGVRIDSGDLEYLAKRVREGLDEAGLREARIIASNELDEHIIDQLVTRGAPIDSWGVGTRLVTGDGDPALTGVYKLVAREGEPVIKVSNNPEKVTNPGVKQVWRFLSRGGSPLADLVCLEDERVEPGRPYTFLHPTGDWRSFTLSEFAEVRPLLSLKVAGGRPVAPAPALAAVRERAEREVAALDDTYKRLINPHLYRVSLSERLGELKTRLIREAMGKGRSG